MRLRLAAVHLAAVGIVGALALSGCVNESPAPSVTPSATPTSPAGPTDEELLAEARAVYDGFLVAVVAVYESDRPDYTELAGWATDEWASFEAAAATDLANRGIMQRGIWSTVAFELDDTEPPTPTSLVANVCADVTDLRYIDESGVDVTPPDREQFVPLAVTFVQEPGETGWLVDSVDPRPGDEQAPCV